MRPEYQLLFASVRQDFQEPHRQVVFELSRRHNLDWELVFTLAREHGVAPLLYLNLVPLAAAGLPLPTGFQSRLQHYCARITILKEQRARQLSQALAYLNAQSIDVMLVKGVASDLLVYHHPWYTFSNDMDIVLKKRREQFAPEALQDLLHQLNIANLEYDFYEHHDLNINGALPVDFDSIWREAVPVDYRGARAYVMPPEDLLIGACINSCRKRYFRLKSLCDIAETVRHFPGLSWERLVAKVGAYDCRAIVYTALLVSDRTLGCSLPPGALAALGVGPVRRAFIGAIVSLLLQGPSVASYPFAGVRVFNREVNLAVLLPYATYRGYQIQHKIDELRETGQRQA
jgi:hypothetical protein